MLGQAIKLSDATMLCATPECGYTTKVNPRSVREHVGAQCPRCHAVMVTDETAEKVEEGLALIDAFNDAVGPVEITDDGGALLSTRIDTAGDVAEVRYRKAGA